MNMTLDTLIKITATDRSSMHGGDGKWTKNRWRSVTPPLDPCIHGLHVVTIRQAIAWLGPRIGIAEVGGTRLDEPDKTIVERARVIEWLSTWNERTARLFAADCAEHVLHHFEDRYPDDDRPRKAIAATRDYAEGRITEAARYAARSAADSADSAAADSASRWAARSAAYSAARSAAYSAARWAARSAAYSAARSAAYSAEAEWQAQRLLEHLRGER